MKISRTSWHYRWWCKIGWSQGGSNRPTSLCSYFWQVTIPILILIAGSVLTVLSFAKRPTETFYGIGIFLALALAGAAMFGCGIGITVLKDRHDEKKRLANGNEHTPNILVEFVKAKKAKVCPRITLVD